MKILHFRCFFSPQGTGTRSVLQRQYHGPGNDSPMHLAWWWLQVTIALRDVKDAQEAYSSTQSYKVWFRKLSNSFLFFSRSLSLLDFFTWSFNFFPDTALLRASCFCFCSFINFDSWTGPDVSLDFFFLFLLLFFSFLLFLFFLSTEESEPEEVDDSDVSSDVLLLLLFFHFPLPDTGDLLSEELDDEESHLDRPLCFLLFFFFSRLCEISFRSRSFVDKISLVSPCSF